jgi:hypothetical protein
VGALLRRRVEGGGGGVGGSGRGAELGRGDHHQRWKEVGVDGDRLMVGGGEVVPRGRHLDHTRVGMVRGMGCRRRMRRRRLAMRWIRI